MAKKIFRFYVINIKLQSPKEGEERINAYRSLFLKLVGEKRFTHIGKNEGITMYPAIEKEENGVKYFYGSIVQGVYYGKDEVRIHDDTGTSTQSIGRDKIIEGVYGDYIFVPSEHRFGYLKEKGGVGLYSFLKHLQKHLPKLLDEGDKITIEFEKEPSIINEIYSARIVYELNYKVTYTNSDSLNAQGQLFDELLHKANIGTLEVNAKSDHSPEGLKLDEADLLGGGLEVAKRNGEVRYARILPATGNKSKKVSNKDKPLVVEFEVEDNDDNRRNWFKKIFNYGRNQ